jgi:hypothetical protein
MGSLRHEADGPPPARMPLVRGHVETWAAAVQYLEADLALILAGTFKTDLSFVQVHGFLFALALRNLIRAVKEGAIPAADTAGDGERSEKLQKVLAEFNRQVPDAVRFRDIVQYLDDYQRGMGRHKRKKGKKGGKEKHRPVRNVAVWLERSSTGTVSLHVADGRRRVDLDVRHAADAAVALAERVQDILQ